MAVWGLIMGRSEGLSGMRADYLKGWCKEAKQEKETVDRKW